MSTEPDEPSSRLGRKLPADLEQLVLDCLEKDRENRPASARAVIERLRACKDAGTWTEHDARHWWEQHEDEYMDARDDDPDAEKSTRG